ncbi:MAG: HK97 gp10 family phage protein [Clostridiales bacterium]|nr:HK97 gp10 family phage protein [Clostridiales bacterium]
MSNISTHKYALDELPDALDEMLKDFLQSSFEARQDAVQAGAEVFKSAIESATPKDTGEMAQSWKIKTKYVDVRYVGNTRVAKGQVHRKTKSGGKGEARSNVPLTNVLEYSAKSPHYGFIRQTFDAVEPQIFSAMKKTIENGGK